MDHYFKLMGAACNFKEVTKTNHDYSRSSSKNYNIVTKHSSQYKDLYSKYRLFENRWTTIRLYQKLSPMVIRNFQKILERGINNAATPIKKQRENTINDQKDVAEITDLIEKNENSKFPLINENIFWCDQEHSELNKMKTLNPDVSFETNEYPEFSNLLFMNLNYKQYEENLILLEDKTQATQKLNNILGSLNC